MERFKIPRSVGGVTQELDQIGALLTATEWKRAALLAAVVRLPGSGRPPAGEKAGSGFFTSVTFAEQGIKGLRSKGTVQLYVQRWLDANDGEYPELGKTITLPDIDWPPSRTGTDGYESEDGAQATVAKLIEKHGVDVIVDKLSDEQVGDLVKRATRTRTDVTREAYNEVSGETLPPPPFKTPPEVYPGMNSDVERMTLETFIGRMESAAMYVDEATRDHREQLLPFYDRLSAHRDVLDILMSAARGFDDEEARRVLQGGEP